MYNVQVERKDKDDHGSNIQMLSGSDGMIIVSMDGEDRIHVRIIIAVYPGVK